jgi:hypothetical protein
VEWRLNLSVKSEIMTIATALNPKQNCYLCGVPVRKYKLKPGEKHPSDELTLDHIPPIGLFPKPRPANLITVPCCFKCNNKHSGFDERLRIIA